MKLKTIKKSDNCLIVFGEWFDKVNGNTYYDATITVAGKDYTRAWSYGYNHGDAHAVRESLLDCGFRLRKSVKYPREAVKTVCRNVLKRDFNKVTSVYGGAL